MGPWYRVFGSNHVQPSPAALLEELHQQGIPATGQFQGDDQGWFRARLALADEDTPLELERYLAREEGIRPELNSWAAWLETCEDNPHHAGLMERMIGTTQIFTLHDPSAAAEEDVAARACRTLCRFLARETAGVYQIDREGFFAADGTLLVPERDEAGPDVATSVA